MKNWWWVALGVVFGLLGAGGIWLASSPPRGVPIQLNPPPTPAPIQVHVSGAVVEPGVYDLPVESRVQDAVQAAGGFAEDANQSALNLAALLEDGFQVWVPAVKQAQTTSGTGDTAGVADPDLDQPASQDSAQIVNINTANQEELETLSGIGPVTAQKIIDYRETNGLFVGIEDIQKVSGIGPVTFEKIKDLISVGSP